MVQLIKRVFFIATFTAFATFTYYSYFLIYNKRTENKLKLRLKNDIVDHDDKHDLIQYVKTGNMNMNITKQIKCYDQQETRNLTDDEKIISIDMNSIKYFDLSKDQENNIKSDLKNSTLDEIDEQNSEIKISLQENELHTKTKPSINIQKETEINFKPSIKINKELESGKFKNATNEKPKFVIKNNLIQTFEEKTIKYFCNIPIIIYHDNENSDQKQKQEFAYYINIDCDLIKKSIFKFKDSQKIYFSVNKYFKKNFLKIFKISDTYFSSDSQNSLMSNTSKMKYKKIVDCNNFMFIIKNLSKFNFYINYDDLKNIKDTRMIKMSLAYKKIYGFFITEQLTKTGKVEKHNRKNYIPESRNMIIKNIKKRICVKGEHEISSYATNDMIQNFKKIIKSLDLKILNENLYLYQDINPIKSEKNNINVFLQHNDDFVQYLNVLKKIFKVFLIDENKPIFHKVDLNELDVNIIFEKDNSFKKQNSNEYKHNNKLFLNRNKIISSLNTITNAIILSLVQSNEAKCSFINLIIWLYNISMSIHKIHSDTVTNPMKNTYNSNIDTNSFKNTYSNNILKQKIPIQLILNIKNFEKNTFILTLKIGTNKKFLTLKNIRNINSLKDFRYEIIVRPKIFSILEFENDNPDGETDWDYTEMECLVPQLEDIFFDEISIIDYEIWISKFKRKSNFGNFD